MYLTNSWSISRQRQCSSRDIVWLSWVCFHKKRIRHSFIDYCWKIVFFFVIVALEQAHTKDHCLLPSKSTCKWTYQLPQVNLTLPLVTKRLARVIYVYNDMAHASTKHTPHFLLYGKLGWLMRNRNPRAKIQAELPKKKIWIGSKKEKNGHRKKILKIQWHYYWWRYYYCRAENYKPVVFVEDGRCVEQNVWSCVLLYLGNSICET